MQRRHYLVAVASGGLSGCSGVFLNDETRDSDGDGVVDEQDYAPRDADVQSKDDLTSGDGGTADTDGDGVIDSEDYAPGDPEVREKADLTDPPKVHDAGVLEVRQTFLGNLDNGREESDGADFWFEAVSETERYLDPREDATFALGGGQPVGRFGCGEADLGTDRIPTDEMKGRYVCAKTDEGRYCEFYVDEITPSPGVMRLAYTTWAE